MTIQPTPTLVDASDAETTTTLAPPPAPSVAPPGRAAHTDLPSRPVMGLPLARVIPQDVHSVLDYLDATTLVATGVLARSPAAKAVGFTLGAAGLGVSAFTDDRLGIVRVIPIEAHEVIDHAWGAAVSVAPFALGYWRRDPLVAVLHVAVGVGHIVASLLTDYRAVRALGRVPRAPRRAPAPA